jgi:hypothetical protein
MSDSSALPPPAPLDSLRMQALVFEELRRIQHLLTERLVPPVAPPAEGTQTQPEEGELLQLLRRLQVVVLEHPLAAQAAFSALVAEGRRFAATPEGAEWKAALAGSEWIRSGRRLWEALSLNILEEEVSTVVPSTYLEAVFRATSSPELESLVQGLWSTEEKGSHGAG